MVNEVSLSALSQAQMKTSPYNPVHSKNHFLFVTYLLSLSKLD